jgi:hypothetical protein
MKNKLIQFDLSNTKWKLKGNGSFGEYYQISKYKGIKLYYDNYGSIKDLLKSNTYNDAKIEFRNLNKCKNSGFTPKPYKLCIVKIYNSKGSVDFESYCPAIIMQHIKGRKSKNHKVFALRIKLYEKYGFNHRDSDVNHNFLVKKLPSGKLKYYLIDLGRVSCY